MSAEQSVKELIGPAWERWSPEKRQMAVASFEDAVSRLAQQIEDDIFAAGVKPALSSDTPEAK